MIVKKKWFAYNRSEDTRLVTIVPNEDLEFPMEYIDNTSKHLAAARVLDLDYAQYLYFLTIMFPKDVEIRVENNFPVVYWERNPAFYTFLQLLNARLSLIMEGGVDAE